MIILQLISNGMIYSLGYSLCIRDGVQFLVKLPGLEEKGVDSSWQIDGPPFWMRSARPGQRLISMSKVIHLGRNLDCKITY